MRDINIGKKRHTKVTCFDEPDKSGACHVYAASKTKTKVLISNKVAFAAVIFQKGPIKKKGVNGCQIEDLIIIAIDRLRGFQSGEFECGENSLALSKLEEALFWLNKKKQ